MSEPAPESTSASTSESISATTSESTSAPVSELTSDPTLQPSFSPSIIPFHVGGRSHKFFIATPEAKAWYAPPKDNAMLEYEWVMKHVKL